MSYKMCYFFAALFYLLGLVLAMYGHGPSGASLFMMAPFASLMGSSVRAQEKRIAELEGRLSELAAGEIEDQPAGIAQS